jgi:hypothetical protein
MCRSPHPYNRFIEKRAGIYNIQMTPEESVDNSPG